MLWSSLHVRLALDLATQRNSAPHILSICSRGLLTTAPTMPRPQLNRELPTPGSSKFETRGHLRDNRHGSAVARQGLALTSRQMAGGQVRLRRGSSLGPGARNIASRAMVNVVRNFQKSSMVLKRLRRRIREERSRIQSSWARQVFLGRVFSRLVTNLSEPRRQ